MNMNIVITKTLLHESLFFFWHINGKKLFFFLFFFNRNFNKMSEKHFGPVHDAMMFLHTFILKLLLHSVASPFSPLSACSQGVGKQIYPSKKTKEKK